MTATSWGIGGARHKMWTAAIVVDTRRRAGVGWCRTKATRPADPVSVTTGGSTGHLERRRHASPSGRVAQDPAIRFLRAAPADDRGCAVTPAACCAAPVCTGAKSVLMHLWKYASKWYPGDGPRFVWPSVGRLAAELGRKLRGVYANLATLEAAGWIVRDWDDQGHKGWTLNPIAVPAAAPEMQLGFAWDDGPPPEPANSDAAAGDLRAEIGRLVGDLRAPVCCAEPVERIDRVAPECNSDCTGVQLPKRKEEPMNNQPPQDTAGQDSLRVFRAYESHRVATLGGMEARRFAPPGLLALWKELGGNAKAWKLVEAYGRRAIDLAAKSVEAGHEKSATFVKCRSDGQEWASSRYKAVMAWQGAAAEPCRPTPPPPPDPIVDGERVHLLEREAWDSGGADAVRQQRAAALSSERLGELAGDFLAKMRGVG